MISSEEIIHDARKFRAKKEKYVNELHEKVFGCKNDCKENKPFTYLDERKFSIHILTNSVLSPSKLSILCDEKLLLVDFSKGIKSNRGYSLAYEFQFFKDGGLVNG